MYPARSLSYDSIISQLSSEDCRHFLTEVRHLFASHRKQSNQAIEDFSSSSWTARSTATSKRIEIRGGHNALRSEKCIAFLHTGSKLLSASIFEATVKLSTDKHLIRKAIECIEVPAFGNSIVHCVVTDKLQSLDQHQTFLFAA